MKRGGFIFTLDALLALVLVLMFIVSIVSITGNTSAVYTSSIQNQNKMIAQNLLETLRTVSLSELVSATQISKWIDSGVLNLTYVSPQMSPLEIAATYWALSDKDPEFKQNAEIILNYLLKNLARNYKYQMIINNYTSPYLTFDNSYVNASDVGTATTLVSGYIKNTTPRGYVAKAYLTKLLTTQEKLIGIQRILAGGEYCEKLSGGATYYEYYYKNKWNSGWISYSLSLQDLNLSFETLQGNPYFISKGLLLIGGSYDSKQVNVQKDLSGMEVVYYQNYQGYIDEIKIWNANGNLVDLELDYLGSYNTTGGIVEKYEVSKLVYYYPTNNDYIEILFNKGVYVDILWKWTGSYWSLYSSNAYTVPSYELGYYCDQYESNSLGISFRFRLPSDVNPEEGILSVYTRKLGNVFDRIEFNGQIWKNTEGELSIPLTEIKSDNLVVLNVSQYYDSREVGMGSGSWIYLRYTTSMPSIENPGLVNLYNVTSHGTGMYYLNSLFVPGTVKNISIRLTMVGVHEVRIYYSNGSALNLIYAKLGLDGSYTSLNIPGSALLPNLTNYTTLENLSRRNFNLVIMLDAYYNTTTRSVEYAGQDYNLEWNGERILFGGYPNSFINITYIPTVRVKRFYVPLDVFHDLSPNRDVSSYMQFSYYLPQTAIPWYVDIWTGIEYSPSYVDLKNKISVYEGPYIQKFLEFPLDLYLIRLAYTNLTSSVMVPGATNTFKIESDDEYYDFRPTVSRAIVHYFLNGYAPYGNVFTYYAQKGACGYNLTYYYLADENGLPQADTVIVGNCKPGETPLSINAADLDPKQYALDDAIFRLFVQLGAEKSYSPLPGTRNNPVRVKLEGIAIKAVGVGNIPTSLGPIQVTLRIWRGG